MGEAKIRELSEIEARAALKASAARRSRIRDRFGRGIEPGDGIILTLATPTDVVWRVVQVTPATEPQAQGGYWADVMATTRVLFRPGMPSDHVILVQPGEPAGEPDGDNSAKPPAPAMSPGGIILSDPDASQR